MNIPCILCFLLVLENSSRASASLGEALGISSCENNDIDLTFLIDSSESMNLENFMMMLHTAVNIIKHFDTDEGHLRTAVVTFGTGAHIQIYLNEYSHELALFEAILRIKNTFEHGTHTGTGIATVTDVIYDQQNGHRPHALKLLILMTDGGSQDPFDTASSADRARRAGIFILAIGIGMSVFRPELLNITGMDDTVIIVTDFQDLKAVATATLLKICPVCEEGAGWMHHDEMCYLVQKVKYDISWDEARGHCRNKTGDLATVRGARDEDFLFGRMSPETQTAYIGLKQEISSTAPGQFRVFFKWQDGTSLRYRNWKDEIPEGVSDKRCVLMNSSSGWEQVVCSDNVTNQFICMKAPLGTTGNVDESLGIPSCQFDDIDLTFLVESSARIQASNFRRMLETVVSITKNFNNNDDHLRTAIVTYGTDVNVQITLNQSRDDINLFEAILDIRYDPQNHTNTGLGLTIVTDEVYKEDNGHRPSAYKLLILLTSGESKNSTYTTLMAERARHLGIIILVLGIGRNINETELRQIAGKNKTVALVSDFVHLKAVASDTLLSVCPACEERAGWMHHRDVCYLVQKAKDKITWLEARRRCREKKGNLATIQESGDEDFLLPRMSQNQKLAYIGLKKDYTITPGKFKDIFRWQDQTPLIYKHWQNNEPDGGSLERCVLLNGSDGWKDIFCGEKVTNQFICIKPSLEQPQMGELVPVLPEPSVILNSTILMKCENGELVSILNVCNGRFDCRDKSDEDECGERCGSDMYRCGNKECISLTFYCDGTDDCGDNSDEETCIMGPCTDQEWKCQNGQCIEEEKRCDLHSDCLDNSDETDCDVCRGFQCYDGRCIPMAWVGDGSVDCDGFKREDETTAAVTRVQTKQSMIGRTSSVPECLYQPDAFGKVSLRVSKRSRKCYFNECPVMFYKCPASYCIPVHAVCNGLFDCLYGEDEASCNSFSCPGYYRCQGEQYCIHPSHFCDGTRHCPKGDDERYCEQQCPPFCECHGRMITCKENFTFFEAIPKDVRKLELSGLDIKPNSTILTGLQYLTILNLSNCGLTNIEESLPYLPNIIEMDLSSNQIQILTNGSFHSVKRLKYLDLSGNVLLSLIENGTFAQLDFLEILNLQNTGLEALTETPFLGLSKLRSLDLSKSAIKVINENVFVGLETLRSLDLRENSIEQFEEGIFNGLDSMEELFTDSFKLCCELVRPKSVDSENCISTGTKISSCQDLLGQSILITMLWCIAVIAVTGNILVLAYRFKYDTESLQRSYGIFVTNLSISDCLMGLYMVIIGTADTKYRGSYVWNDYEWRHSTVCKFAGTLATLSSEASCMFITLITLDRFLAIKFPFGQVKFTVISAKVWVIITWVLAAVLATVPLLPLFEHWALYSQNGVCLALPFSSERKPGWYYTSSMCVGFNLVLFLLIAVVQLLIYRSIKSTSKIRPGGATDDSKIARKLFLVVFTDFLCWFPVGVMGIMALQGFPISREVYAWTAVTVLPVNSALNPILYTVPSMIQARRELLKKKATTKKCSSSLQGVDLQSIPVNKCRRYVGNPTTEMENLSTILNTNEVACDVKFDLVSLIVGYILDLYENGRRFQPINDVNVYVKRRGEEILSICLSVEPDSERCGLTQDVVELIQLLKELRNDLDIQQDRYNPADLDSSQTKSSC